MDAASSRSFASTAPSSVYGMGEQPIIQPMTKDEIWRIFESDDLIDEETLSKCFALLKSGFDPFEIDPNRGCTLLYQASGNGKTEIVRLILAPPDDINAFDQVAFAADLKAKIDVKNGPEEATALHRASQSGHLEIAQLLVQAGASIKLRTKKGSTPLHLAAGNNCKKIVKFLIEASQPNSGDYINASGPRAATALHWASQNGHIKIVKLLLEAGASIPLRICDGSTPLHLAAGNNHKHVVECLIGASRSNPDYLNAHGYNSLTAMHLASLSGYFEIVQLLVQAGASIELQTYEGSTPLHLAAGNNQKNVVECLIRASRSNPDYLNVHGPQAFTAMHLASQNGHLEIVRLLVQAGASLQLETFDGAKPIILAARFGHTTIVWELLMAGAHTKNFITLLLRFPGAIERFIEGGLKNLSDVFKILTDSQETIYAIHFKHCCVITGETTNLIHFKYFSLIILILLSNRSFSPIRLRERVKKEIGIKLCNYLPIKWTQTFLESLETKFQRLPESPISSLSSPEEIREVENLRKEAETLQQAIQSFNTCVKRFLSFRLNYSKNFDLFEVRCDLLLKKILTLTNSESNCSSSSSIIKPGTPSSSSQSYSTQPLHPLLSMTPSESASLVDANRSHSAFKLVMIPRDRQSTSSVTDVTDDPAQSSAVSKRDRNDEIQLLPASKKQSTEKSKSGSVNSCTIMDLHYRRITP